MEAKRAKSWVGWTAVVAFLVVAGVFGIVAAPYVQKFRLGAAVVAGIYCCFLAMLMLALAPGVASMRPWIQARMRGRRVWVLPLVWCVPYFLYAAGTGDFRWIALGRLLGVSVPLVLVYRLAPVGDAARFTWQDAVVGVWLIAALLGHQLAGIWIVPANLDFMAQAVSDRGGRLELGIRAAGAGAWV